MLTRTRYRGRSPGLGLSLLLACGGPPASESGTGSPSGETSAAGASSGGSGSEGQSGSSGGSSGASEPTGGGPGGSSGEPTGSGADASSAGSSSGGVGETTGGTTSGESSEGGGSSTGAGDSSTGAAADLVLDPDTLVVFELPINSLRYAVSGFDAEHATCVSIIFTYPGEEQHCDDFTVGDDAGFPYVFITPDAAPPCMDWDYQGNVQLDAASGCMQLTKPFPPEITIDMQLAVSGAPFTGSIAVASQ